MAVESQQALVTELADMFESHARRQRELLTCLQVLRAELRALPPGPHRKSPGMVHAPGRWDNVRRRDDPSPPVPISKSSVLDRDRRIMAAWAATAIDRPARRPSVVGTAHDTVVGAPGHAPTRDYNYFAELDNLLSKKRRPAGS